MFVKLVITKQILFEQFLKWKADLQQGGRYYGSSEWDTVTQ